MAFGGNFLCSGFGLTSASSTSQVTGCITLDKSPSPSPTVKSVLVTPTSSGYWKSAGCTTQRSLSGWTTAGAVCP